MVDATLIPDDPAPEQQLHDEEQYNPNIEPQKADAWLNRLRESEKAFESWNDHCDRIEKKYANLEELAGKARDKEFQMFWANMETLRPTIYAKPPVPVVATKFKDRRPVYNAAAELLERSCCVAFDLAHIDRLMKLLRDDVVMTGRGVAWMRYESAKGGGYYGKFERICIDFKHRKDFLHSVSRNWTEVTWVAAASYLTRAQAMHRFSEYSGEECLDAEFKVDRDAKEIGGADARERAKFWEIWDRQNERVVWVAEGCEDILDEADPHLELQNFFPCPEPAYGSLQPGSLVPVPDILQYKDQLDELNLLTAKIHALSDVLEARGFYPAGSSEIGDAVQAAISHNTPGRVLVPIANWSSFGGSKEIIVWMPIEEIVAVVQQCVSLRQQIIQDIYQIMGLSDIMRGATDARETLGAQELKSQFGSTRVRDKQLALVRIARDMVEIASDIICENFDDTTIIYMTQTQLPTEKMMGEQVNRIKQQMMAQARQLEMMQQENPQGFQALQADPQKVGQLQQMQEDGQRAIDNVMNQPSFEQVIGFLRDERARAFVLDIETDSTVLIDENTEKQRRTEFMGMFAQLFPQMGQLVAAEPSLAGFVGEMLKFSVAPYRVSRSLDTAIDNMIMLMEQKAGQPKGDDPTTATNKVNLQIAQMENQAKQMKDKADVQLKAQEIQMKDATQREKIKSTERIHLAKSQESERDMQADAQRASMEMLQAREEHQQKMLESQNKMREAKLKSDLAVQQSNLKANDMAQRQREREAMAQFKMMQPQRPVGPRQ